MKQVVIAMALICLSAPMGESAVANLVGNSPSDLSQSRRAAESGVDIPEIMRPSPPPYKDLPAELDYSKDPTRVSPVVYDQGACQIDDVFAALGAIEGQLVPRNITKKLVKLAAQQMVDCVSKHDSLCRGQGYAGQVIDRLRSMRGIETEEDYGPYTGVKGYCHHDATKSVMRSLDAHLASEDRIEEEVRQQLYAQGPLMVYLAGLPSDFDKYQGGVYTKNCTLGHGIGRSGLLVGYGTDPKEGDYWKIKFSRGPKWGEAGFMRMKRGVNMCSLAGLAEFIF